MHFSESAILATAVKFSYLCPLILLSGHIQLVKIKHELYPKLSGDFFM